MTDLSGLPDIEILTDEESLTHYGRDWTRFWPPAPQAVVFPRRTEDVVALVRWAGNSGIALVPSGGRTGLSGGAVAAGGEVVVSLEKMRSIVELDDTEGNLTVDGGATIGEIQAHAGEAGWFYPVDWAAADSAQAGGSIATNAGGIRVLRYGMTRDWVRGLTVVTGTGEVLELNRGLVKNNAGPDLAHLFVGSEGILGFITRAILGLTAPPAEQAVMLLGLSELDAVMPAFSAFKRGLVLSAFEFFDRASIEFVTRRTGREFPIDGQSPYYAVVEFDNPDANVQDRALAVFEELVEAGHAADGVISQSEAQAGELWQWRDAISEAIAEEVPYKNDLSVRVSRVPAFLADLDGLVADRYPDFRVIWFGHIGDGNLHMNVLKPADWDVDDFRDACVKLSPAVFELVRRHGGSVSAEHGIGLLKREFLHYTRSPGEIELLRGLKRLFDPDGILNPGKVLPD